MTLSMSLNRNTAYKALLKLLDQGKLDRLEEELFDIQSYLTAAEMYKQRTGHSVFAEYVPETDQWREPEEKSTKEKQDV